MRGTAVATRPAKLASEPARHEKQLRYSDKKGKIDSKKAGNKRKWKFMVELVRSDQNGALEIIPTRTSNTNTRTRKNDNSALMVSRTRPREPEQSLDMNASIQKCTHRANIHKLTTSRQVMEEQQQNRVPKGSKTNNAQKPKKRKYRRTNSSAESN